MGKYSKDKTTKMKVVTSLSLGVLMFSVQPENLMASEGVGEHSSDDKVPLLDYINRLYTEEDKANNDIQNQLKDLEIAIDDHLRADYNEASDKYSLILESNLSEPIAVLIEELKHIADNTTTLGTNHINELTNNLSIDIVKTEENSQKPNQTNIIQDIVNENEVKSEPQDGLQINEFTDKEILLNEVLNHKDSYEAWKFLVLHKA